MSQLCPGSETYVEREDLTNLSIRPTICTADKEVWDLLMVFEATVTMMNNALTMTSSFSEMQNHHPPSGSKGWHLFHLWSEGGSRQNIICPQSELCFVRLKRTIERLKMNPYFILCSAMHTCVAWGKRQQSLWFITHYNTLMLPFPFRFYWKRSQKFYRLICSWTLNNIKWYLMYFLLILYNKFILTIMFLEFNSV